MFLNGTHLERHNSLKLLKIIWSFICWSVNQHWKPWSLYRLQIFKYLHFTASNLQMFLHAGWTNDLLLSTLVLLLLFPLSHFYRVHSEQTFYFLVISEWRHAEWSEFNEMLRLISPQNTISLRTVSFYSFSERNGDFCKENIKKQFSQIWFSFYHFWLINILMIAFFFQNLPAGFSVQIKRSFILVYHLQIILSWRIFFTRWQFLSKIKALKAALSGHKGSLSVFLV